MEEVGKPSREAWKKAQASRSEHAHVKVNVLVHVSGLVLVLDQAWSSACS